jgi:hypothetical protein
MIKEAIIKNRSAALLSLLLMTVAVAARAQTPTEEIAGEPEIDPAALQVLERLAKHLGDAQQFAFVTEANYDTVQESGAKVEFGASRRTLVSRPDRLRLEARRRDGFEAVSVFDGKAIWVHDPAENAYATIEQPGDIDAAVDFAVTTLRMKAPLADLISPAFYDNVTGELTRALYLGETVVAGVPCEHLLLSNDYADFQMWVAAGAEPLPRRIVITYREEQVQPQFRAQFLKWEMSPTNVEAQLQFTPPEGAERIRFYVDAPTEADEGES